MKAFEPLAGNGLKRGLTTGTCATAAATAAATLLLCGREEACVRVELPGGERYAEVPVRELRRERDGGIYASVVKDGGDDPDQTHGAAITVRVRRMEERRGVVFKKGEGVGLVTKPGLQVPVGEPAVNPVPRAMIREALARVAEEAELEGAGFEVEVGCVGGEAIAKRTFNPRLGIEGGISIIGTSGVVEPKSMEAFRASVDAYLGVALASAKGVRIVLSPGNIGQRYARRVLGLEPERVVQMSNFLGDSLDTARRMLLEKGEKLEALWLVGHPSKLAKVLSGHWNTHSSESPSPLSLLMERLGGLGGLGGAVSTVPVVSMNHGGGKLGGVATEWKGREFNTVDEFALETLRHGWCADFWNGIAAEIADAAHRRVGSDVVKELPVRLFTMDDRALNARDE